MTRIERWRLKRKIRRDYEEWARNGARPILLPPENQTIRELQAMLKVAKDALRRIASPDEMAGNGETETMTGPAAGEMRCRMAHAAEALEQIEPKLALLDLSDTPPEPRWVRE